MSVSVGFGVILGKEEKLISMKLKTTEILIFLMVIVAFVVAKLFYLYLPVQTQIVSHWNASGEPDGYMNKFWGIFTLPIMMLVMSVLYFLVPKLDPLKSNLELFRKQYDRFWIFMFLFFMYIYGLQMAWNLGLRFDFALAMVPAMLAVWYFAGDLIENSKRNWFVGIKTPWTLSSDFVWEKTHKFGGKLFKISAVVLAILGMILKSEIYFIVFIVSALAVSVVPIVYSYQLYNKNKINIDK